METAQSDIVGVREAARQLNVNASTISRQLRAGIIPNRGTDRDPKVSVEEARRARQNNLDPSQQRGAHTAPASSGYTASRSELEAAKAAMAQLDLAEKLGLTVAREDIEDAIATAARELRDALARRWRALAVELQGLTAREIEAKGMASDEAVLADLTVKLEIDADTPATAAA